MSARRRVPAGRQLAPVVVPEDIAAKLSRTRAETAAAWSELIAVWQQQAAAKREQLQAYIDAGFSREEAMALLVAREGVS